MTALLVKAEQKITGKDAKKTIADAQRALSAPEVATRLLAGDLKLRRTAGGVVCRVICCEGVPMLFEQGPSGLLPTLPALWREPIALPSLFIPPEASRFVLNGADLMLPGMRACDDVVGELEAGAPACLRILGNAAPFAVGVLVANGGSIVAAATQPGSQKGVALRIEHVFGDALWRHCDRPIPNPGFSVDASGAVAVMPWPAVAAVAPSSASMHATVYEENCANGGGAAAVDVSDEAAAALGAMDVSDAEGAVSGKTGVGDKVGKKAERAKQAESEPEEGRGEEGGKAEAAEAMDSLLRACFLYAARRVEDKALPMAVNSFYASVMRPARPAGSSLDVKTSTWKKLIAFVQAMEKEGLCTVSAAPRCGGEPSIKAFHRTAPAYVAFEGWEASATAEAVEASASGSGAPQLQLKRVYRPIEAMRPVFAANGAADSRAYYDEAQALAVLEAHVRSQASAREDGGGAGGGGGGGGGGGEGQMWALDPLLSDALFKGQPDPIASSTTIAAKEVRRRFLERLEGWTRVSGGALEKAIHSKGDPPSVVIASEQRRGHHVTLLSELQAFVLDPYQTARELQGICGATAKVEEEALKSGAQRRVVCVQGLWDRTIAEWLGKRHGLPEVCIENRAALKGAGHHQKKDKKATNVRRS